MKDKKLSARDISLIFGSATHVMILVSAVSYLDFLKEKHLFFLQKHPLFVISSDSEKSHEAEQVTFAAKIANYIGSVA